VKSGSLRHSPFLKKSTGWTCGDWSSMTILAIHITLWLFNIAMENDPFIDGLPTKNSDFSWLC
jgi:hypothetical protein